MTTTIPEPRSRQDQQDTPADKPRSSREVYRDWLVATMQVRPDVVCLDSDTGLFPAESIDSMGAGYANLGIAEQNLVGAAAGLALSGKTPYVNTMSAFAGTRAVEFIKVDLCLNRVRVRIAATHSGLSAGHLGPTHHALEDLAVLRALPHLTVVVPSDEESVSALVEQSVDVDGPVYLRLGRNATPPVERPAGAVTRLGRASLLRQGADVLVVAAGGLPVVHALAAADRLAESGVHAGVLEMHTLKPFDVEGLLTAASAASCVVTVEEHWAAGGLGSACAEVLAEHQPTVVRRVAVGDHFVVSAGSHGHLTSRAGLDAPAIVEAARAALALAESTGCRGTSSSH